MRTVYPTVRQIEPNMPDTTRPNPLRGRPCGREGRPVRWLMPRGVGRATRRPLPSRRIWPPGLGRWGPSPRGWVGFDGDLTFPGRPALLLDSEPIPVALKRGRGQLRDIGWRSDLRKPPLSPKDLGWRGNGAPRKTAIALSFDDGKKTFRIFV